MVQQQTASENPVTLHIPQEHTKSMVAEKAEYNTSRSVPVTNVVQQDLFEEGILSAKAQKEVKIIGQVFSTYWVLQYEDKMYMIDQHAAHEKVLYERFMKEFEQKKKIMNTIYESTDHFVIVHGAATGSGRKSGIVRKSWLSD